MTTNTIPKSETESDATPTESDAVTLSNELGVIGTKTVDGEYIRAPVEKIEPVDDETIRLWYRFPTGEFIPETFEIPFPWDTTTSKLARLIDYNNLSPGTVSQLEKQSDIEVLLEETVSPAKELTDEIPCESVPYQPGDETSDTTTTPKEHIYGYPEEALPGNDDDVPHGIDTWKTVDPIDLVDDDRYTETEDEDEADRLINPDTSNYVNQGIILGAMLFFTLLYLM